jgi:predicted nucleic acid-binding protein
VRRPDPPTDHTLAFLDPGERAAIPSALAVQTDRLLIDDLAGRAEAERRRLRVTGTAGGRLHQAFSKCQISRHYDC